MAGLDPAISFHKLQMRGSWPAHDENKIIMAGLDPAISFSSPHDARLLQRDDLRLIEAENGRENLRRIGA